MKLLPEILLIITLHFSVNLFAQEFKVITYNIRNNNPRNDDGLNSWKYRKENVAQLINFHEADIFGLQEAYTDQVQFIASEFSNFKWVGVGRDDGNASGEYAPVFYNTNLFKMTDKGWFWLSETPDIPSKGWDANHLRICTWIILNHLKSNKQLLVLNTHLDHRGTIARKNSVQLLIKKIKEINKQQLPVILMGDLNLTPEEKPILYLKKHLSDSKDISIQKPYGPEGTTNKFDFLHDLNKRIDYIFVSKQLNIFKYAVLSDSKKKNYFSDHLPVFIKAEFR
ncbi:endonuclease/exonuclease/phosphatase family protein [Abyssalbus ytuae]|uniref:Endonuclease/exonuclease/phosphatase family protein n=1 Tax=Abyssalbus ytuae TaxID=2926907 RepID=A0A9E6ZSX9_9FLAO|nr:endonuclease/exonuclease/phosphatase family protein [Abyssalbus ytuae]UOB17263.1 endonuclease/exonuclease/phosphatase family protein [Abyssalbus ytuae]